MRLPTRQAAVHAIGRHLRSFRSNLLHWQTFGCGSVCEGKPCLFGGDVHAYPIRRGITFFPACGGGGFWMPVASNPTPSLHQ